MNTRNKNMVKSITAMFCALTMLVCGALQFEMGEVGVAICLIMCSLYVAMWFQAGIIRDDLNAYLEKIKDEKLKN